LILAYENKEDGLNDIINEIEVETWYAYRGELMKRIDIYGIIAEGDELDSENGDADESRLNKPFIVNFESRKFQ
jgi:hypothetical protein